VVDVPPHRREVSCLIPPPRAARVPSRGLPLGARRRRRPQILRGRTRPASGTVSRLHLAALPGPTGDQPAAVSQPARAALWSAAIARRGFGPDVRPEQDHAAGSCPLRTRPVAQGSAREPAASPPFHDLAPDARSAGSLCARPLPRPPLRARGNAARVLRGWVPGAPKTSTRNGAGPAATPAFAKQREGIRGGPAARRGTAALSSGRRHRVRGAKPTRGRSHRGRRGPLPRLAA